ncbi:unnamed protein product [Adineta steineri]|uniref:RING-type domain-containing protein n=1 Tax=Adineta steineri TaxID=433720 RepID=A0A818P6P2_9BILA|nr:unnamed protein product [Adineta steineri]CAF3617793.1 unnamed protein product [Adineta steineri]
MSSSAMPMPITEPDEGRCEVCLDEETTTIGVITCAHRNTFCKNCIKTWLSGGNVTCPKCRAPWPIENIDQHPMIPVKEIHTIQHHFLPPAATGGLMHNVLTCCAIGLLIGIMIYPTAK